jgi:signal transduction histidine kinase
MGVYLLTLVTAAVLVTEGTYYRTLQKEIRRSLDEENSFYFTLTLFLTANQREGGGINLEEYGQKVLSLVEANQTYLEIYNEDLDLLASSTPLGKSWPFERKDLKQALSGERNYVLRWKDKEHYLFINEAIKVNESKLVLSLVKNITYLDEQKKEQYLLFFRAGLIGLVMVAVVTGVMSKIMLKPVKQLTETVKNIAAGSYKERVKVKAGDEIGLLAEQFNRMAEEIESRIKQLEEEGERKQRFIDNLTHELRTPLTSVIGYADLLAKIKYDEEVFRKGLHYIYAEGNRMLKLINSLMDLILLRQNAFELRKMPVLPLLNEVRELMQFKAAEKEITLRVEGEDREVAMDRDLLKGALMNLVDNALKASEEGKTVILGVKTRGVNTCLYVADQGKGMEEEEVGKILEPFYRVDKARSRREGGAGLGLAICQEIVRVHGGRIEIESEPGKGTRVKIII